MLCKGHASVITLLLRIITSLLHRVLLLPIIIYFNLPNLQMDARRALGATRALSTRTERSSCFSSSGVEKVRLGAGSVGENEGCGEGVALAGWRCQRVGRGRGRLLVGAYPALAALCAPSADKQPQPGLAFSSGFCFFLVPHWPHLPV